MINVLTNNSLYNSEITICGQLGLICSLCDFDYCIYSSWGPLLRF